MLLQSKTTKVMCQIPNLIVDTTELDFKYHNHSGARIYIYMCAYVYLFNLGRGHPKKCFSINKKIIFEIFILKVK